jgi:hypothetical protein
MTVKILSFLAAIAFWLTCVAITFFALSFANGLKVENSRAFLPYILFGVLLAAGCVTAGRHLPKSGATIVGVVIGLLPVAILTIYVGIELPLSIISLATASGIGGGVAASTSSCIQNKFIVTETWD